MLNFCLNLSQDRPTRILILGAHSDDIEIGCGGLLKQLVMSTSEIDMRCVVFSSNDIREQETRRAITSLVAAEPESLDSPLISLDIRCEHFRDGYFFDEAALIKDYFETLKQEFNPELILTHYGADAHQDHRLISELTWNTFRSHTILEYEIPKYDSDMGNPNVFVPLTVAEAQLKADIIYQSFESQQHRKWFEKETFMALTRLRGMQCDAPEGHAEAFYSRKTWLKVS